MEEEAATSSQPSGRGRRMTKQLTGKRDDTPLHSAARAGNIAAASEILSGAAGEAELKEIACKQNQAGETALYAAAESGCVELVREMVKYYDLAAARIKARNGFDAFHIAVKQGDIDVVRVLMETEAGLAMTADVSNTTALHTAATQGHVEIVMALGGSGMAAIAKSNGKTALHSAARNGHSGVVAALLEMEPGLATRTDKKGQTALHMAVKGLKLDVVEALVAADPSTVNIVDTKGNTPLHIASRKGRSQIVRALLGQSETDKTVINRAGETAIDTAEKTNNAEVAAILREHGVLSANARPKEAGRRELKQTVSDIKHEVHYQLEHTRQTRRRVQGIAKRLNKMHSEGLNNAINSTTVVAVLIATVAFAAIFTVPGQYEDDPKTVPRGSSLGQARVASNPGFIIFFVFDALALFISLAVVVVQTSVVVIESTAKKQMMAVINKLMWLACVLVSVAFLALSFVVVGEDQKLLAIGVTIIGTTIMAATLGTMCFWVVRHRIEASSIRRNSLESRSKSLSLSRVDVSDSEMILNTEFKKMYAI